MSSERGKKKGIKEARELKTANDFSVYKQLAQVLPPFRSEPVCSRLFIVEGSLEHPRIGIRYPGRKLKQRTLENPRKNSLLWANLLDFEVVPFIGVEEKSSKLFTYRKLLQDFDSYKKENQVFWDILEQLHAHNVLASKPPILEGIESRQYLEMLKWMWIQEDLNYRLSWEDTESPIPYRLQNKNGKPTRKGAGRFKFFAGLLLVKYHKFPVEMVGRIIP